MDLSDMLRLNLARAKVDEAASHVDVTGYEQADPSKGERWCGAHRAIEVGPCPDYQIPTLDQDDIETIRGALEYVSTVLTAESMSASNLPRLSAIIRAQAKLDMIGEGGTFVATPF